MADLGDIPRGLSGDTVNVTLQAMKEVEKEKTIELRAEQTESQQAFLNEQQEAINPFAARYATRQRPIKTNRNRIKEMMKSGEKAERLLPVQQIRRFADQFQQRNPELRANVLTMLREYIKPGDTKEDIMRKLLEYYPDVALADEALEFLLETTEGELNLIVQQVKEELNEQRSREIIAGRNIGAQAREAAEKGLGTPTNLRDMYRDITGNPRDSTTLFEELSQKYAFKDLKKVMDFLLHSLGSDLKAKGPSIPRGQLHRLISETRNLQAILGVYRFFRGRMHLVETLFHKEGLEMPSQLSFESMAKAFMQIAAERYPNAQKILQGTGRLGIDKWIMAKIIVLSQLRDAIREVAMNMIYKSLQHRDELYMAIIEALEDLEEELEELLEREEEEGEEEEDEGEEEDGKGPPHKKRKH